MMSAPALPTPQGAMPAGFATFLANIGQVSTGGEASGFDQLLAAAPVAVPVGTTPIADTITTIQVDTALPGETAAPQIEAPPAEASVAVEAPSLDAETADANATALAANLLIALNGSVPAQASAPEPVPAESETETTAAPDGEAAATVAADWTAIVVAATPAAAKPAKLAGAAAAPDTNAAPAAPAATALPRMRDAASTAPILAGAEPPVAKPADAAPSMTILFTQPAAQAATAITEGAAPAQFAERVLDMDSDGVWIDQLARDIAATRSDRGDISFRLMPRHLGRLDVAMQMGDEGVALRMDTHHEATATIVTAAQGRLVDELRQQGVRVAGAEVTCTPGETGRQSQGQGRGAAPDPSHLVETATERADARPKTDSESRAADRRGRFA